MDIHDIKPLQYADFANSWGMVVGAVLALLLLAGLVVWFWRRRHKRRSTSASIVAPLPHETALAALRQLQPSHLTQPAAIHSYYFKISQIVRTYVEQRFGLNATDLTTEEICLCLPQIRLLATAEQLRLSQFLRDTDRVKYASMQPNPEQIAQTYQAAILFVEATCPPPPLPTAKT